MSDMIEGVYAVVMLGEGSFKSIALLLLLYISDGEVAAEQNKHKNHPT